MLNAQNVARILTLWIFMQCTKSTTWLTYIMIRTLGICKRMTESHAASVPRTFKNCYNESCLYLPPPLSPSPGPHSYAYFGLIKCNLTMIHRKILSLYTIPLICLLKSFPRAKQSKFSFWEIPTRGCYTWCAVMTWASLNVITTQTTMLCVMIAH